MIILPEITLITITGKDYQIQEHLDALSKSRVCIRYGNVSYPRIDYIKDIDTWNRAVIYEMPKYVTTSHALLIHADGYVINPDMWNPKWLEYDYIGAPWPLPQDDYSYRDEEGQVQRVGNSVSLRSKRLIDLIASVSETEFWAIKEKYGNTNEDGFICCHKRKWLESQGCKFAPLEEAIYFGKEHTIPENKDITKTFTFHSL